MNNTRHIALGGKLAGLRLELIELAVELERTGRLDAADVAMTTAARVEELLDDELGPSTRTTAVPGTATACGP